MDKILGWPEPTEVGGHMVKRSDGNLDNKKAVFTCVDCGTHETGGVVVFQVGTRGCPGRPESLNYLGLRRPEGEPWPSKFQMREHWLYFARVVGLTVANWQELDDGAVIASFAFNGDRYVLSYSTPNDLGVELSVRRIEED